MSFGGEAAGSDTGVVATFKSFVSEEQLEERRRVRQEEWEKVRKADDPVEAPEEEYDNRSLFDRLQEQKRKKEEEYEEKHRLSNQVQGIDEGEAEFLQFVSERKSELTKARDEENESVLQEYREALVDRTAVAEPSAKSDKKTIAKPQPSKAKSQLTLLAGAVKRKNPDSSPEADSKKSKTNNSETGAANDGSEAGASAPVVGGDGRDPKLARVVAVLPGLGAYSNSSDSDSSSSDSELDNEQQKVKILKQCQHQGGHH